MPAKPSRKRRPKRGAIVASLGLTSLMDMFTIILIFLLHTFSAEGEMVTTSEKFQLPLSSSDELYTARLTIVVTPKFIIVENKKIMKIEDIDKKSLLITPLFQSLEDKAKKSLFIAGLNPELELGREVVIQGDRGIEFRLLERVMYTCGQVGYNNIALAVIRDE
jgi:biopolymer transport protein ExbD